MDAQTRAWIDQQDAHLTSTIRRYGWSVQYVGGDECSAPNCPCLDDDGPPFAYTIGLFGLDHPELLIFGLDMTDACSILNELGERIRSGDTLMAGLPVIVDQSAHAIIPESVPNPGEIVLGANNYYQRPAEASVPVLQLTYADDNGSYPWEETSAVRDEQPRPGTFEA